MENTVVPFIKNTMGYPTPEEFLREKFLQNKKIEEIHASFRCELRWLFDYSLVVSEAKDEDLLKVISKINFLMGACLRKDNDAISEFLSQWGKIDGDSFTLDYKKIIDGK